MDNETINNGSQQSNDKHDNKPITSNRQNASILGSLLSIALVILLAFAIAFLVTRFVFQSYQVDGESMEPTLENNDRLIVWKGTETWDHLTGQKYVPKRGDIIIFNEPGLTTDGTGTAGVKQLVKRVIGLPGDRVVVQNGSITIYNKQHPNGFDPDTTLPYGKQHQIPVTTGNIDITLGPDQIFVCGDNRTNSLDSRIFGPVSLNNVIGQLVLRIYPFNTAEKF